MTKSVKKAEASKKAQIALIQKTYKDSLNTALELLDSRLDKLKAELYAALVERDNYKKAKAENDERFMTERDEARESVRLLVKALRIGMCDVPSCSHSKEENCWIRKALSLVPTHLLPEAIDCIARKGANK
jgi:predicted HTH domain antitoxin